MILEYANRSGYCVPSVLVILCIFKFSNTFQFLVVFSLFLLNFFFKISHFIMQQYYETLSISHIDKRGRKIYNYRCRICNQILTNSKNAAAHCRNCLKLRKALADQKTIQESFGIAGTNRQADEEQQASENEAGKTSGNFVLTPEQEALIELISDMNIPYTQLCSPSWDKFIHTMRPDFIIPNKEQIREITIKYADKIVEDELEQLRGKIAAIAIDGATLASIHAYAIVLVTVDGIKIGDITQVDQQTAQNLSTIITKFLNKCQEHSIFVAVITSDNAANIKAAIERAADKKDLDTLKLLLGNSIFRVSCSAHTAQLTIGDTIKESQELSQMFEELILLYKFIQTYDKSFKKFCKNKVPKYISTRWNTLNTCVEFILEHEDLVNQFIQDTVAQTRTEYEVMKIKFEMGKIKNPPEPPLLPPFNKVPESWKVYNQPLTLITKFTNVVEADLAFLQDMFVAAKETQTKLKEQIDQNNPVAKVLLDKFLYRFLETADITLAHLAYTLTPEGLYEYRGKPEREIPQMRPSFR